MTTPSGSYDHFVGTVTPGGSLSATVGGSYTSHENSSGGFSYGGFEAGGESGTEEGTSNSTTVNVPHDGQCAGNEDVWAEYDVSEQTTFNLYQNCVGDQGDTAVTEGRTQTATWTGTDVECS